MIETAAPTLATHAESFAAAALGHIAREYPHVQVHAMTGDEPPFRPRERHPIFFGSYDWHSCVHAHWLLARLLRLFPDGAHAPAIRDHFAQALTEAKVAGEVAYFARPAARGFERPYGWAWLLMLAAELRRLETPDGAAWRRTLAPLEAVIVDRFMTFLPLADYPVRAGGHANTAFALRLVAEYVSVAGHAGLGRLVREKATAWYAGDVDCQAWEPSGEDFLSPALIEAALMGRIAPREMFLSWFGGFLPRLAGGEPAALFTPARVSDRADGKIAHLDGLNLSRAWCWRSIAAILPDEDARRSAILDAADRHLAASLPHVTGDYMGEHWLATFAALALE